jgi:hypothetical protein
MDKADFWGTYRFKTGQTLKFKAGYAIVWVRHTSNGWQVKKQLTEIVPEGLLVEEDDELIDDSNVLHFYSSHSDTLFLTPSLPDKAVVFRNNKNIKIGAGEQAPLFFKIPLSMQFFAGEITEGNLLLEISMQRLSDTWFGEIDNGEPAYSIGSNYDKSLVETHATLWQAIAPVDIINSTSGILDLQRLILRVEDFNLYRKSNLILTSHATIEFKGQEQAGNVNLTTKENIHGNKPEMIAKSRLSDAKKMLRRNFFFIKNIYQN